MRRTAAEQKARDLAALELRRAGVPVPRIMQELRFAKPETCRAAIERAMRVQAVSADPVQVRDLELDRLDRIQQSVWVRATKGDLGAVNRVMQLAELRMRLAGVSQSSTPVVVAAFDRAVEALRLRPEDAAAVAAGRRIAERIDAASGSIDPQAETKALYLVPHLMHVLEQLGATPAARGELADVLPSGEQVNERQARLTALRGGALRKRDA